MENKNQQLLFWKKLKFNTILPADFLSELTKLRGSNIKTFCGKTWTKNKISFYCKNCGLDSTCAVCSSCFYKSNHENHDVAVFTTNGGCCDCGDVSSWRIEGSCTDHGALSSDEYTRVIELEKVYFAKIIDDDDYEKTILNYYEYIKSELLRGSINIKLGEFLPYMKRSFYLLHLAEKHILTDELLESLFKNSGYISKDLYEFIMAFVPILHFKERMANLMMKYFGAAYSVELLYQSSLMSGLRTLFCLWPQVLTVEKPIKECINRGSLDARLNGNYHDEKYIKKVAMSYTQHNLVLFYLVESDMLKCAFNALKAIDLEDFVLHSTSLPVYLSKFFLMDFTPRMLEYPSIEDEDQICYGYINANIVAGIAPYYYIGQISLNNEAKNRKIQLLEKNINMILENINLRCKSINGFSNSMTLLHMFLLSLPLDDLLDQCVLRNTYMNFNKLELLDNLKKVIEKNNFGLTAISILISNFFSMYTINLNFWRRNGSIFNKVVSSYTNNISGSRSDLVSLLFLLLVLNANNINRDKPKLNFLAAIYSLCLDGALDTENGKFILNGYNLKSQYNTECFTNRCRCLFNFNAAEIVKLKLAADHITADIELVRFGAFWNILSTLMYYGIIMFENFARPRALTGIIDDASMKNDVDYRSNSEQRKITIHRIESIKNLAAKFKIKNIIDWDATDKVTLNTLTDLTIVNGDEINLKPEYQPFIVLAGIEHDNTQIGAIETYINDNLNNCTVIGPPWKDFVKFSTTTNDMHDSVLGCKFINIAHILLNSGVLIEYILIYLNEIRYLSQAEVEMLDTNLKSVSKDISNLVRDIVTSTILSILKIINWSIIPLLSCREFHKFDISYLSDNILIKLHDTLYKLSAIVNDTIVQKSISLILERLDPFLSENLLNTFRENDKITSKLVSSDKSNDYNNYQEEENLERRKNIQRNMMEKFKLKQQLAYSKLKNELNQSSEQKDTFDSFFNDMKDLNGFEFAENYKYFDRMYSEKTVCDVCREVGTNDKLLHYVANATRTNTNARLIHSDTFNLKIGKIQLTYAKNGSIASVDDTARSIWQITICGHIVHRYCFDPSNVQNSNIFLSINHQVKCPICRSPANQIVPILPLWKIIRPFEHKLNSKQPINSIVWNEDETNANMYDIKICSINSSMKFKLKFKKTTKGLMIVRDKIDKKVSDESRTASQAIRNTQNNENSINTVYAETDSILDTITLLQNNQNTDERLRNVLVIFPSLAIDTITIGNNNRAQNNAQTNYTTQLESNFSEVTRANYQANLATGTTNDQNSNISNDNASNNSNTYYNESQRLDNAQTNSVILSEINESNNIYQNTIDDSAIGQFEVLHDASTASIITIDRENQSTNTESYTNTFQLLNLSQNQQQTTYGNVTNAPGSNINTVNVSTTNTHRNNRENNDINNLNINNININTVRSMQMHNSNTLAANRINTVTNYTSVNDGNVESLNNNLNPVVYSNTIQDSANNTSINNTHSVHQSELNTVIQNLANIVFENSEDIAEHSNDASNSNNNAIMTTNQEQNISNAAQQSYNNSEQALSNTNIQTTGNNIAHNILSNGTMSQASNISAPINNLFLNNAIQDLILHQITILVNRNQDNADPTQNNIQTDRADNNTSNILNNLLNHIPNGQESMERFSNINVLGTGQVNTEANNHTVGNEEDSNTNVAANNNAPNSSTTIIRTIRTDNSENTNGNRLLNISYNNRIEEGVAPNTFNQMNDMGLAIRDLLTVEFQNVFRDGIFDSQLIGVSNKKINDFDDELSINAIHYLNATCPIIIDKYEKKELKIPTNVNSFKSPQNSYLATLAYIPPIYYTAYIELLRVSRMNSNIIYDYINDEDHIPLYVALVRNTIITSQLSDKNPSYDDHIDHLFKSSTLSQDLYNTFFSTFISVILKGVSLNQMLNILTNYVAVLVYNAIYISLLQIMRIRYYDDPETLLERMLFDILLIVDDKYSNCIVGIGETRELLKSMLASLCMNRIINTNRKLEKQSKTPNSSTNKNIFTDSLIASKDVLKPFLASAQATVGKLVSKLTNNLENKDIHNNDLKNLNHNLDNEWNINTISAKKLTNEEAKKLRQSHTVQMLITELGSLLYSYRTSSTLTSKKWLCSINELDNVRDKHNRIDELTNWCEKIANSIENRGNDLLYIVDLICKPYFIVIKCNSVLKEDENFQKTNLTDLLPSFKLFFDFSYYKSNINKDSKYNVNRYILHVLNDLVGINTSTMSTDPASASKRRQFSTKLIDRNKIILETELLSNSASYLYNECIKHILGQTIHAFLLFAFATIFAIWKPVKTSNVKNCMIYHNEQEKENSLQYLLGFIVNGVSNKEPIKLEQFLSSTKFNNSFNTIFKYWSNYYAKDNVELLQYQLLHIPVQEPVIEDKFGYNSMAKTAATKYYKYTEEMNQTLNSNANILFNHLFGFEQTFENTYFNSLKRIHASTCFACSKNIDLGFVCVICNTFSCTSRQCYEQHVWSCSNGNGVFFSPIENMVYMIYNGKPCRLSELYYKNPLAELGSNGVLKEDYSMTILESIFHSKTYKYLHISN